MFVTDAIADYIILTHDKASAQAIRVRLAHIVNFIGTLPNTAITCDQIDADWVQRFCAWAIAQPIVSPTGIAWQRSLSTVENSVLQLAAAINHAHANGRTGAPARFRSAQPREVNRTPQFRADVPTIIRMFAYATDPTSPSGARGRGALHRFLIAAVATLARPDAVYDISVAAERRQWNGVARILNLNPKGRRQTRKYRPTIPIARQMVPILDQTTGYFVGVLSVRTAFEAMVSALKLPRDGESGTKLIRRSMAHAFRQRGVPVEEIEAFLGHRRMDSVSELYAPFDPAYLSSARTAIETIIDEIIGSVPRAFHRNSTGDKWHLPTQEPESSQTKTRYPKGIGGS